MRDARSALVGFPTLNAREPFRLQKINSTSLTRSPARCPAVLLRHKAVAGELDDGLVHVIVDLDRIEHAPIRRLRLDDVGRHLVGLARDDAQLRGERVGSVEAAQCWSFKVWKAGTIGDTY